MRRLFLAMALLGVGLSSEPVLGLESNEETGSGPDFVVPDPNRLPEDQASPAIAWMGSGWTVAWVEPGASSQNLWLRKFFSTSLATSAASIPLNGAGTGQASSPHLATFDDGQALAVWASEPEHRVYVTFLSAGLARLEPLSTEIPVNSGTIAPGQPRAAARNAFTLGVVTWLQGHSIFFNRLDLTQATPEAALLDGAAGVNAGVAGSAGAQDVAGDASGGFLVVYVDTSAASKAIRAKRFLSDGTADGSELLIDSGARVSSSSQVRISRVGSGQFAVIWSGPGAGGASDIWGQLLELTLPGLQTVGDRFTVNALTAGEQAEPAVVGLPSQGTFWVAWKDCFAGASCSNFTADPKGFDGSGAGIAAQKYSIVAAGGTASAQKAGSFRILDTTIPGEQGAPVVATSSDGSLVAAWQDQAGNDGGGLGVFTRRLDSAGASGIDAKVFEKSISQEKDEAGDPLSIEGHSIAFDDSGNLAVAWESDGGTLGDKDVYLARLNPAGARLAVAGSNFSIRVNESTVGNQLRPKLAVHPDGTRGIVAWVDRNEVWDPNSINLDYKVKFRQYSVSGGQITLGAETIVAAPGVLEEGGLNDRTAVLDIALNGAANWATDGRFVIAWQCKEEAPEPKTNVCARLYQGNGAELGAGLIQPPITEPNDQRQPSVGMASGGNFSIVWLDQTSGEILGRRYSSAGATASQEIVLANSTDFSYNSMPDLAMKRDGTAILAWVGQKSRGDSFRHVYGKKWDTDGSLSGANSLSSDNTLAAHPAIALLENGAVAVAWEYLQNSTFYYRRYRLNLTDPVEEEQLLFTNRQTPMYGAIALSPDGDLALLHDARIANNEGGSGTNNLDLLLDRITPQAPTAAFSTQLPTCIGQSTSLTDASSAQFGSSIGGWNWDLEHTGSAFSIDSTLQNPVRAYPNGPLTLQILQRVWDGRSTPRAGLALETLVLEQQPGLPTPSFTAQDLSNRTAELTACSTCGGYGTPYLYDWNFGDGQSVTGSENNPQTHQYSASGSYAIQLDVTDAHGCKSSSPQTQSLDIAPRIASFTATAPQPAAGIGATIEFELIGDPNRVARVELAEATRSWAASVSLAEQQAGVYSGSYVVPAGIGEFSANALGFLSESGGVRPTSLATDPFLIDALPPVAPSISSDPGPGPGADYTTASPALQLEGTAAVDSQTLNASGLQDATLDFQPGSTAWSWAGTLAPGANALQISATDHVGNSSAIEQITITLDQQAPVNLDDLASGGTILAADGTLELSFPPNSIPRPVPVAPVRVDAIPAVCPSRTSLEPGLAKIAPLGWELSPSENFSQPVRMTFTYNDGEIDTLDESKLTLAWFDQAAGRWTREGLTLDSFEPANNRISMFTTHFSLFAFAETGTVNPVPALGLLSTSILALLALAALKKRRRLGILGLGLLLCDASRVGAMSNSLVISQVYPGGGSGNGMYDFVELFNLSSAPINLGGWSLQYAASGGSAWIARNLDPVELAPGHHYLIQLGGTLDNNSDFAFKPDSILPTVNLDRRRGKLALAHSTLSLGVACPLTHPDPKIPIVDFIGWKSTKDPENTPDCFEGAHSITTTEDKLTSLFRLSLGDSDDNGLDFGAFSPPHPKNSTVLPEAPAPPLINYRTGIIVLGVVSLAGFGLLSKRLGRTSKANQTPAPPS